MDTSESSTSEVKLSQLKCEIRRRIRSAWWHQKLNRFLTMSLSLVTILASTAAALTVSSGEITTADHRIFIAVVALLPALFTAINRGMHFENRAQWAWKRARLYEGVLRALEYENFEIPSASKRVTEIESDLANEWLLYDEGGRSSKNPRKP